MAAFAPGANAQITGQGYGGVGYTHFDLDQVDLGGLTGRLGWRFVENFAVEGEASLGIADDEGGGVSVELENSLAVYGVGILPLTPQFDLIGRAGFARIEVEANAGPFAAGADNDGFAFGVGGQFNLNDRWGIRGEYTRLDGDGDDIDAFGVSAAIKF